MDEEDSFDKIYKGEVSKSGAAILPSKRARRIPEAIQPSPKVVSEQTNIEADKEDQTIEENQPEIEEVVTPTPTEEKTE